MSRAAFEWGPLGVDESSMVMTKRFGLIRIQYVRDNDLVWDGMEYVPHGGVVFLGQGAACWHEGLIAARGTNVYTGRRTAPMPIWVAKMKGVPLLKDGMTEGPEAEKPEKEMGIRSRLYTIMDCGPRHRFACSGAIVHNLTTRR